MQLTLWTLPLTFSLLHLRVGESNSCADWQLHGRDDVCCLKCSPGHRMVSSCGKDRNALCEPCGPNTFIANAPTKPFCDRCTQCLHPQFVEKACTSSSDTVCGCKEGFRCGNKLCSYCVDECGKGQEPTSQRTCRDCPEETFNDQIHSNCTARKTSCPNGETLVRNRNATTDNECLKDPKITTVFYPNEHATVEPIQGPDKDKKNILWSVAGIFGGFSLLILIFMLIVCRRKKGKTKTKEPMPETLPPEELRVTMDQDDACSFRQPEQEQGGSLESLSTQDSESKLIV
ncbi:tumor necrosis factor receptor superfamily member 9a [Hoplias malabaricus]|uniref:tumor necrosis factor receptor superfamily member 9a n=1 Tax=Hoplias malabaricus TaxID=27720 RepID=UPI003462A76B